MYLRELVEQIEESKNIVGFKLIDLSLQYFQDFHASAAPMQHAAIIIAFEAYYVASMLELESRI